MTERERLIKEITNYLAFLRSQVELLNSLTLTDINKISENFYRDFLNILFGYSLININIEEKNAAAIDLGDLKAKLAIQVTSTKTLEKIKKTHKSFVQRKLHLQYDRLVVLNIVAKCDHRTKSLGTTSDLVFDIEKDVWDVTDLLRSIDGYEVDDLEKVKSFLEKNIKITLPVTKLEAETSTLIKLIEVLSDEAQPMAGKGTFKQEPDPEGKIDNRFSNHATFLKLQYTTLYIEYGAVMSEVVKSADLGPTKIRRLGTFLMSLSDKVLGENNGDAKLAMDKLVEHYSSLLRQHSTSDIDNGAIRFFLIDQLIRCNVFPNKDQQP